MCLVILRWIQLLALWLKEESWFDGTSRVMSQGYPAVVGWLRCIEDRLNYPSWDHWGWGHLWRGGWSKKRLLGGNYLLRTNISLASSAWIMEPSVHLQQDSVVGCKKENYFHGHQEAKNRVLVLWLREKLQGSICIKKKSFLLL